jgi:hypothetical protein
MGCYGHSRRNIKSTKSWQLVSKAMVLKVRAFGSKNVKEDDSYSDDPSAG